MKKLIIISIIALTLLPGLLSASTTGKVSLTTHRLIKGDEVINGAVAYPPYPEPQRLDNTDVVGDTMTVGTTWYEYQHNGSIGRMIARSNDGYIQMVWMNGLDAASVTRHIYYNYVEPNWGLQGYPGVGFQVDNATRGGYTCLDVDTTDITIAAFHITDNQGILKTALANDIFPHSAAFLTWIPPQEGYEWIWPKMQIGRQRRCHFLSTGGNTDNTVRYGYGTYDPSSYSITFPSWPNTWIYVDTSMTIGPDVATSGVSNRVCLTWTHPRGLDYGTVINQENNDVYYVVDNDGLNINFSNPTNLTNFIPPDLFYLPDTLRADMDTLRAYCDVNAFFDQQDYLHIAFTTQGYYELEGRATYGPSLIWHWSEQYPNEFHLVANGWVWGADPGAWQLNAQRPSLAQNPQTGYLYCCYHVFDQNPNRRSHAGYPSGEVYVSVSTDGGLSWSVGTNVTYTLTPNNAPAGQCLSEVFPSIAKVVDGYCHILYILDLDAGAYVQGEGDATLNRVKYHRVAVNMIPTTPLIQDTIPFHVETGPSVPVSIDLTPYGTIVIPPGGGNFYYNVALHNNQTTPATFDVWTMVRLPNGNWYPNPIVGPAHRTLVGSASADRDLSQYLPPGAPAGLYTYEGRIGTYPNTVWDTDSFTFTKAVGGEENATWFDDLTWSGDLFNDLAESRSGLPDVYSLSQNYPNPFNPMTAISYKLQAASYVNLLVYDISGKKVAELVNGWREAGSHYVTFDATGFASGVYLYKMEAGGFSDVQKMVLLK